MPNEIGNPNYSSTQNYDQHHRENTSINPELSLEENIEENLNQFQTNNSQNISDIFAQISLGDTQNSSFSSPVGTTGQETTSGQRSADSTSSQNKLSNNETQQYFTSTNTESIVNFDYSSSDFANSATSSIGGVCVAQSMIYAKGHLEGKSEEDSRPNSTNSASIQNQFMFMFDAVNSQLGIVSHLDRATILQNNANNLGMNIADTDKPQLQSNDEAIQDMIENSRDENGQLKETNFVVIRDNMYVTDEQECYPDSHALACNFNPETNELKVFDPNIGSVGYNMDPNNALLKEMLFADPTRVTDAAGNEYTNHNTGITCYKLDAAPEAKQTGNLFTEALNFYLPQRPDTPDLYSKQNQDTNFFG